jgi:Protein of unknown function (DUF3105)
VAKKNPKNVERRAMVEKMRQEQARKERNRSLLILGVCVVAVVALLGAALVPYLKDRNQKNAIAGTTVSKLGATASAAACDSVITKVPTGTEKSGATGNHVDIGTKITYSEAPPAFGQHWPNYLTTTEIRSFYSPTDRPEVERMVHSLEHGHTLIWYDDTVKPGSQEYKDLQAIAQKYSKDSYVNILPWKATDGGSFPAGKHVALTHWAGSGNSQKGVWQYCGKPSGAVIATFVKDYPNTDSPEPGAM